MPDTRSLEPNHESERPTKRSRAEPVANSSSSTFPDAAPLAATYQDSEPYKHISVGDLFGDSLVGFWHCRLYTRYIKANVKSPPA